MASPDDEAAQPPPKRPRCDPEAEEDSAQPPPLQSVVLNPADCDIGDSPGSNPMAEDQQKPREGAMVGDQPKPIQAAACARYLVKEVDEVVAFLNEITASLQAATGVRDGLVDLIVGFGKCDGDARAVVSRVAELLDGHPDVLGRFTAFINWAKAPAVPPRPLAVTRPRRSSTRRNERDGQGCRSLLAVKEEPDLQDYGSPRKSQAGGAGGHGGHKRDDLRVVEAEAFLNQVRKLADHEVRDKFLALLDLHVGDPFVDEIYGAAKDVLGPAHAALLGEFSSTFLPGQKEWEKQVRREAQRNRRRVAAAARRAVAADNQRPSRAADDDHDGSHWQHGLRAGGQSSGGRGTAARGEFDHLHATLEVVKKRRATDGDHRDDNYASRFRSKKPRTDGGGGGHRRHAVGHNGEQPCSGESSRVPNGDVHGYGEKKPRRRAPSGGEGSSAAAPPPWTEPSDGNAMFRRFRELWVFYTRYSTLVETMARVLELLRGGGGSFPTSMEELFPHREHLELLGNYYGDHWCKMSAALENGDSTGPALEAVLRRLKVREEEAVAEEARERRRKDTERATERLAGLVANKVRHKERLRRQDAGDGCARHHGSKRVPGGDRRSSTRVVEY